MYGDIQNARRQGQPARVGPEAWPRAAPAPLPGRAGRPRCLAFCIDIIFVCTYVGISFVFVSAPVAGHAGCWYVGACCI